MSRPKLLLADDSIAIRKVVELTFADEGIEVFAVPDAPTAMEKFIEVQPDIVLVDAGLEGTSGYQICEMIKTDEATRDTPVLLLVGSFEPFDHDAAERACADGVITKPFQSIRDLVSRVSELLGRLDPVAEPVEDTALDVATAVTVPAVDNLAEMSTAATVPAIDTADIDDLYSHSFHETVKIDEFDTLEDTFDDAGTDDELIETTRPNEAEPTNGQVEMHGISNEAETVKEFDWSPAAIVGETEPEPAGNSFAGSPQLGVVPSIEAHDETRPEETPVAEMPDEPAEQETQVAETADEPVALVETPDESFAADGSEIAGQADWSTGPEVEGPNLHDEANTLTEDVFPQVSEEPKEPSDELISLIVQRVIEQMSDHVVREVAVEAVPRVAEKLIREALDPLKKN